MQQELKKMIFMTVEEKLSLKEFDSWLYKQDDLSNQMSDDLILGVFTFNYNQKAARHEFKNFLQYFDEEEFLLWKVKANLQDLIDGKETRDRILSEFYGMGYDELPCLQSLGYYMYEFEDADYLGIGKQSLIDNLKKESSELLGENLIEESKNTEFKISAFKRIPKLEFSAQIVNSANTKEWWEFWK
jgi:hypothetical protein